MNRLIITFLISTAATFSNAAIHNLTLVEAKMTTSGGVGSGIIDQGDVQFYWNDNGTGLSSTGSFSTTLFAGNGTYPDVGPTLFTNHFTDFAVTVDGATATSYSCQEGVFGSYVGANICEGYTFGGNHVDDGGPGFGDDEVAELFSAFTLDQFDMTAFTWNGNELQLFAHQGLNEQGNINPYVSMRFIVNSLYTAGDEEQYYSSVCDTCGMGEFSNTSAMVSAVPVPAAAWLFGSSLLGLFGIKQRGK